MRTDDRRSRFATNAEDVKRTTEGNRGGSHTVKLPEGVAEWRPDAPGTYLIRVLPYAVEQPGNPDNVPVGRGHYRRTYSVHFDIGGSGQAACCAKLSFGKPCPLCSRVQVLARDYKANELQIKDMKAKHFCLFSMLFIGFQPERGVLALNPNPNTIHLFSWAYSKFAETLEKELKRAKPECVNFASVTGGMVLRVRVVEETYLGKKFLTCDMVEFLPGKQFADIPDAMLDKLPNLDACLIEKDAALIEKLFHGLEEGDGSAGAAGAASAPGAASAGDASGWGVEPAGAAEAPFGDGPVPGVGDEEPVLETCKACKGSGKSSKGKVCKACNGTGKVTAAPAPDAGEAPASPAAAADDGWGSSGGSSW